MRILITGASGLLGRELSRLMKHQGHDVSALRRGTEHEPPCWDPASGKIQLGTTAPEVVVHLAGENIAGGRWTAAQKARIRDSRIDGTRHLAAHLAAMDVPPKAMICASAIGYYGDRGDSLLSEADAPGDGFLADVCSAWEAAADPAREAGIRVVHARIGVVLSTQGGALQKMIPPFRFGLGGPFGNGRQYVSWIHIGDLTRALALLVTDETHAGAVNLSAPHPVTNREFARALGAAIHRPAALPLPPFAIRLLLGAMGEALLLSSTRVTPTVLQQLNFAFKFTHLDHALSDLLGTSEPTHE